MTLMFTRAAGDSICDEAAGGHDTVAIRVPSHEKAREILAPCGFFVSAPSANKFGRVSPTTAQHVQSEFGDDILILDGDPSQCGLESTIISCVESQPQILRAGAITSQDILRVTGFDPVANFAGSVPVAGFTRLPVGSLPAEATKIAAPGTLENHYAPSIPVYVVNSESGIDFPEGIEPNDCAFLTFSDPTLDFKLIFKMSSYEEYARELYGFFRKAEDDNCKAIFAVAPENEGIGVAIIDRLSRAANSKLEAKCR